VLNEPVLLDELLESVASDKMVSYAGLFSGSGSAGGVCLLEEVSCSERGRGREGGRTRDGEAKLVGKVDEELLEERALTSAGRACSVHSPIAAAQRKEERGGWERRRKVAVQPSATFGGTRGQAREGGVPQMTTGRMREAATLMVRAEEGGEVGAEVENGGAKADATFWKARCKPLSFVE
jgi:hypothetical protein